MKKFIINENMVNSRSGESLSIEVEADKYENKDGYFEFWSDENGQVFTIDKNKVKTVRQK